MNYRINESQDFKFIESTSQEIEFLNLGFN